MKSEFTKFEGGIPEHYDHGLGPNIFADFAKDLAGRVASCAPESVLELASGTGIVTRLLRDEIDDACEIVATDLNEPMLEIARRKFAESERITLCQADAQSLPFDDESFHVVTCQFGVMFFPDKESAYREALRVLTPGGRYIFNVWDSFENNPFARVTHATVAEFFPNDPPGFYRLPFSYHNEGEIIASVENAGFVSVGSEAHPLDKVVEDYDRFAQGIVFGNPLVEEIRTRGDVDPEAVRTAIAAALRKEFGNESSSMSLRALVVTGTRPSDTVS